MSDLLARLIEAGTPAALVAEVARELARAEVAQEAITTRREADRERQARRRHNVTSRDAMDVTDTPALSPSPNENNSNPHPHTHPDNNPAHVRADPFPCPEFCEAAVWRDFKANRKAKRLPNTPTAHAKLLRDIAALADPEWPPGRLMEAIVARGWAAAYDPRETRNAQPSRQQSPRRSLVDIARGVAADLEREAQASPGF